MPKQLIVNADDYGRSPGVSRGILKAHREGIVTSTTTMMNLPGTEADLREALACPELGLGVHLVFCSWTPVLSPAEVPGLVDARGHFLDQHTCWVRAEEIPLDQLRAELAAQVRRFQEIAGRRPDHLDCHQFVHAHPRFFGVYVELASEFRLPVRQPFSGATDWKTQLLIAPFLDGFDPRTLQSMIAADLDLLERAGVAHPDRALTTFFGPELATLDNLLHLLDTLPTGLSEMMCHPGFVDGALAASGYTAQREVELGVLTHPAVRQRIRDLGIELVSFRVLA